MFQLIEQKILMIAFFTIFLSEMLLEIFPQSLFVFRVDSVITKAGASCIKVGFCFLSVAIFKEVR